MWKLKNIPAKGTPDEKKVRSTNFWSVLLIFFIILWMAGAYVYLDQKTNIPITSPSVVVLDVGSQVNMSNFFQVKSNKSQISLPSRPMFETRDHYEIGDVVVVKFFYVEAVVVEELLGNSYTIMYKNHEHTLELITLPRVMLLYPKEGVLNPVSLLVD